MRRRKEEGQRRKKGARKGEEERTERRGRREEKGESKDEGEEGRKKRGRGEEEDESQEEQEGRRRGAISIIFPPVASGSPQSDRPSRAIHHAGRCWPSLLYKLKPVTPKRWAKRRAKKKTMLTRTKAAKGKTRLC